MLAAMSRRGLALAAGAVLSLYAGGGLAQQPAARITIDNFAFTPPTLTVAAGTQVVWVNKDEEPHTVMSADSQTPFKSPALDTDDKFAFTFTKPGTYKYFCTIHSHMVGTVVVQ